jgi:hypothetical protein
VHDEGTSPIHMSFAFCLFALADDEALRLPHRVRVSEAGPSLEPLWRLLLDDLDGRAVHQIPVGVIVSNCNLLGFLFRCGRGEAVHGFSQGALVIKDGLDS